MGPTLCSWYSSDVAMPKLPPPPRMAQKRSASLLALTCLTPPSAITSSGRRQVVERQAVLGHQPAQSAAERQAGNTRRADDATGGGQAVHLGLAIEFLPQDATLRDRAPALVST